MQTQSTTKAVIQKKSQVMEKTEQQKLQQWKYITKTAVYKPQQMMLQQWKYNTQTALYIIQQQ